jgi:molecular chaperone GrpE (heat shock protein)
LGDGPILTPQREAAYFRERAAEERAMAEKFRDPGAKKTMLDVADMYERLAESAERLRPPDTKVEK